MNLSQLAESDARREEALLRVRHHAALIVSYAASGEVGLVSVHLSRIQRLLQAVMNLSQLAESDARREEAQPTWCRSDGHHWCQAARTAATCTLSRGGVRSHGAALSASKFRRGAAMQCRVSASAWLVLVWKYCLGFSVGYQRAPGTSDKSVGYQRALRCQLRDRPFHPFVGRATPLLW